MLTRRFILTALLLIGAVVFTAYAGLPILAKIILLTSSNDSKPTPTPVALYQQPVLDALMEATNSGKISVSGYSDPEVSVHIVINGDEQAKTLSDKDGKFIAKNISLNEGDNTITAYAKGDTGESSISEQQRVTYKKGEPKLDITSPKDGSTINSDSKQVEITGTTDPGNRVFVNNRISFVDTGGAFSYRMNLSDGDNTISVIARDVAGNEVKKELKIKYSP
jgi:bacillopeptidase F